MERQETEGRKQGAGVMVDKYLVLAPLGARTRV